MGTLFWQVNDCWQVASWASIDCFGRWKGLQYGAKHFRFIRPEITCEKIGERTWKLASNQFAKFVEVNFGPDVILSDNYFDLVPGRPKYITLECNIGQNPEIYCLYDSFSV